MKDYRVPKHRFRVLPFANPRTGSQSWRVTGTRRNGERIRENFDDGEAAQSRQIALEAEYRSRENPVAIRSTNLTEGQLKIAQACFDMVEEPEDLRTAVLYWFAHGRGKAPGESPRIDDAFEQYKAALVTDASLRTLTKTANRLRASAFVNGSPNVLIAEISPELIEGFLDKLKGSPRNRVNYKAGISKFLAWCMERPRRWLPVNPCAAVKVKIGEALPPVILSIEDCDRLLKVTKGFKNGRLMPYLALTMFAGLRPFEARRMKWEQVNFDDGEIRIEGAQSKTGRPRTFKMDDTTAAWLKAYKSRPFFPDNFANDWRTALIKAGFGSDSENPDLRPWTKDVLRHTSISHYFRQSGSYGLTAERFGNSEGVIKRHYQGRVSSEDTKKFYALLPLMKV